MQSHRLSLPVGLLDTQAPLCLQKALIRSTDMRGIRMEWVLDWHLIAVRVSGDKTDKSGDVSRVVDARLNALVQCHAVRSFRLAKALVHLYDTGVGLTVC